MATVMAKSELSTQSRIATIGKLNYLDFFGLRAPPFRNTSDIAELFLNEPLNAARTQIKGVLDSRESGVLVINGAPGSGKTTLVNRVVDRRNDRTTVAKINRTLLAAHEFLQILLHLFGMRAENLNKGQMLDKLRDFLIKKDRDRRQVILVVDEAQNLQSGVLELLPQLVEPRVENRSGLFVILIGQDGFEQSLLMRGSKQLKEAIRYQTYLTTLNQTDTGLYIQHQLAAAGLIREVPFSDRAMVRIHQLTGGSMRLINTLCDFVLFNACMGRIRRITPDLVQTTFNALQWEPTRNATQPAANEAALDAAADGKTSTLILEFERDSEFRFDKETVTIGRATDNDICIRDLRVSRHHARLTTSRQGISVEDLGSTNGVYVNEERVKVRLLRDGDVIKIDSNRIRFQGPAHI